MPPLHLLQDPPDLLVESHWDSVEGPIQPPPPQPLPLAPVLGRGIHWCRSGIPSAWSQGGSGQLWRKKLEGWPCPRKRPEAKQQLKKEDLPG